MKFCRESPVATQPPSMKKVSVRYEIQAPVFVPAHRFLYIMVILFELECTSIRFDLLLDLNQPTAYKLRGAASTSIYISGKLSFLILLGSIKLVIVQDALISSSFLED